MTAATWTSSGRRVCAASLYDLEHRIVAGGQVKWVREKAYLEFDSDRQLLGGFGVVQDITLRRQAEESLRVSEAGYAQLFANMLEGFAYCRIIRDENGRTADFVYAEGERGFRQVDRIDERGREARERGDTRHR